MARATKTQPAAEKKVVKKRGTKKDPNAPKRSMSAYFLWLGENRARLTKPGMSVAEVAKLAGAEWKKVTDKSEWEAKSREDKKRYEREIAAYNAQQGQISESSDAIAMVASTSAAVMEKVIRLDRSTFEIALSRAAEVLKSGGVVALPTDTVYGLTSLLRHSDSLYKIKRRNPEKPLGLFISAVDQLSMWAVQTVDMPTLRRLLPGPVTLIFDRSIRVPPSFNPSTRKVGIRIPENRFVQELCARLDEPLAQTSANISGGSSPTSTQEFANLWEELDLVIDSGTIGQEHGDHKREGSTVVDLSLDGTYSIIRDGCARVMTEHVLRDSGLTATSDFAL